MALTGWVNEFWKKSGPEFTLAISSLVIFMPFQQQLCCCFECFLQESCGWLMRNFWFHTNVYLNLECCLHCLFEEVQSGENINGICIWQTIWLSHLFSRGFPKIYSITEITVCLWESRCWTSVSRTNRFNSTDWFTHVKNSQLGLLQACDGVRQHEVFLKPPFASLTALNVLL